MTEFLVVQCVTNPYEVSVSDDLPKFRECVLNVANIVKCERHSRTGFTSVYLDVHDDNEAFVLLAVRFERWLSMLKRMPGVVCTEVLHEQAKTTD